MIVLEQIRQTLKVDGLTAALKLLNSRTPHRFTGVFFFEPPVLRNFALADAWGSEAALLDAAPLEETFCGLVGSTGEPFSASDVRNDARLVQSPLRNNAVESYCGVMLHDIQGKPFGTLCHFDTRPCDVGMHELEFLESVAPLLSGLPGAD